MRSRLRTADHARRQGGSVGRRHLAVGRARSASVCVYVVWALAARAPKEATPQTPRQRLVWPHLCARGLGHKKTTPLITLHVITEDGEHTIIFSVMTIGASSPTAVAYQGWRHLWAHALLRMCDVVALCVHVAACSLFLVSLSLKLATGGWHGKASPCSSSSSSPSSCSTVPHAKCGKGCATPDAKRVLDSSERMTHSAPSHLTGRTLSEEASSSCSSAEPADRGSSADRPVRLVSACFARCSLGDDDIDADAFEIACRRFAQDILERIGTLGARITARETHANQDKLRAARCAAQAEGKQQPSQKSRRGESKSRQRARSLPPVLPPQPWRRR